MGNITFSPEDRILIANLTAELKRLNDREERTKPEHVLSIQQVAALTGRTRQTVSLWVRQGRLHKVERGGLIGILESEVEAIKKR